MKLAVILAIAYAVVASAQQIPVSPARVSLPSSNATTSDDTGETSSVVKSDTMTATTMNATMTSANATIAASSAAEEKAPMATWKKVAIGVGSAAALALGAAIVGGVVNHRKENDDLKEVRMKQIPKRVVTEDDDEDDDANYSDADSGATWYDENEVDELQDEAAKMLSNGAPNMLDIEGVDNDNGSRNW